MLISCYWKIVNVKTICPISNYVIKSNEDWTFTSDNGNYKMIVSFIGDNIICLQNFGYTSNEVSVEIWPKLFKLQKAEQQNNKFFIIHDYSNYKGADTKARIGYDGTATFTGALEAASIDGGSY